MRHERLSDGIDLYLGDCREILPTLGPMDGVALISDPPYGQNLPPQSGSERILAWGDGLKRTATRNNYAAITGDGADFDPSMFLNVTPEMIFFGAHKFADRLPPGGWLVWDKVPTGKIRNQGDGEAAWINRDQPMRIFRLLWDGLCVGAGAKHEVTAGTKRVHPAQKPEILMRWCIGFVAGKTIFDPFMGSGSTGVAAVQMGRKFIGIEIEPKYFEIACKRIDAVARQSNMFAAV